MEAIHHKGPVKAVFSNSSPIGVFVVELMFPLVQLRRSKESCVMLKLTSAVITYLKHRVVSLLQLVHFVYCILNIGTGNSRLTSFFNCLFFANSKKTILFYRETCFLTVRYTDVNLEKTAPESSTQTQTPANQKNISYLLKVSSLN